MERSVYETLDLTVARHPSESTPFLLTRVIAYALNTAEGIEFSSGLSTPGEPAIAVRDLTGAYRLWIEIGQPSPEQLQKALGMSEAVHVYAYKDPRQWVQQLQAARNPRLAGAELFALAPEFLSELEGVLERRNRWTLVHSGGEIFVTAGDATMQGALQRVHLELG
jgi:uncharacterized protein YaeQ